MSFEYDCRPAFSSPSLHWSKRARKNEFLHSEVQRHPSGFLWHQRYTVAQMYRRNQANETPAADAGNHAKMEGPEAVCWAHKKLNFQLSRCSLSSTFSITSHLLHCTSLCRTASLPVLTPIARLDRYERHTQQYLPVSTRYPTIPSPPTTRELLISSLRCRVSHIHLGKIPY